MKISGIYSITNKINNKTYYGSSNNCVMRFYIHKCRLKKNNHINKHLQSSFNKYGENNFEFKIEVETLPENLQNIEQYYLDWIKLNPKEFYNITYDAFAPSRGMKRKPLTDLQKQRLREVNLGKKHTEETKKKHSIASSGKNNPMYGKPSPNKGCISPMRDKIIYTLKNVQTHEIFKGSRFDFKNKHQLNPTGVWRLLKGYIKIYKNWILIDKQ